MNDTSAPLVREPASPQALVVLFGCTVAVVFNIATLFNGTLTAFIKPVADDTGWSRGEISLGLSAAMLPLLLLNPLVGHIADRFGPRRVIATGAPLFALALASLAWIPPIYPLFLACCALVGMSGALTYNTVYYAIIARWFDGRLGLALGVTAAGTGAGLMIAPIAAQTLISELGWRGAYMALGAASAAVVLPLSLLLIRDPPRRAVQAKAEAGGRGRVALRSLTFWRLALTYFLTGLAINATVVHLMPLLTDRGMPVASAALLASNLGLGVLLARLAAGFLLDYVDAGLLGGTCFLLAAGGIAMLVLPIPEPMLLLAVLLVGAALGAEGDVLSYVTRRVFGSEGYGVTVSLMTSAFLAGVLLGPLVNGGAFDATGSYRASMSGFVVLALFAAALHAGVTWRRPAQP
jgi:MFS family permease